MMQSVADVEPGPLHDACTALVRLLVPKRQWSGFPWK